MKKLRFKRKYIRFKILSGLLLLCNVTLAQQGVIKRIDGTTTTTHALDSTILQLMSAAKVTGLEIAIINDYKIVYEKAFGYGNIQNKELLKTSTVLYGASLSKAVFTYVCLDLVPQGVLSLDKPLYQ